MISIESEGGRLLLPDAHLGPNGSLAGFASRSLTLTKIIWNIIDLESQLMKGESASGDKNPLSMLGFLSNSDDGAISAHRRPEIVRLPVWGFAANFAALSQRPGF
jgi:hypothetical protein